MVELRAPIEPLVTATSDEIKLLLTSLRANQIRVVLFFNIVEVGDGRDIVNSGPIADTLIDSTRLLLMTSLYIFLKL